MGWSHIQPEHCPALETTVRIWNNQSVELTGIIKIDGSDLAIEDYSQYLRNHNYTV